MITHITVEDAAKLISRLTNANEMQALTYIREAADRGEIQTADALEKLQAENAQLRAELERVTAERDAALVDLRKWKVCATCKQYNPHGQKSNCKGKKAYLPGGNWTGCSKWEWKGIKEG